MCDEWGQRRRQISDEKVQATAGCCEMRGRNFLRYERSCFFRLSGGAAGTRGVTEQLTSGHGAREFIQRVWVK